MRIIGVIALASILLGLQGCGLKVNLNKVVLTNSVTGQRGSCEGSKEEVQRCLEQMKLEGWKVGGLEPQVR
jgi:hypothetical protein